MLRVRNMGDHAAFAGLVGRWESPVRRLCARMTGDEHRGEDLTQETFTRVFVHRGQYEEGRRFSTWLWRIALNLCYEESRRVRARREMPLAGNEAEDRADRPAAALGPDEIAVSGERTALVRAALLRLPEAYRAVVVMREYEQLKFREIAEVLNVPEGTVKWRMAEALDQLGRDLREMCGEDGSPLPQPNSTGKKTLRLTL